MSKIERYIANIERQLFLQVGLKALLSGFALAVFSMIFTPSIFAISVIGVIGFFVFGYFLGLFQPKRTQALRLLHDSFPDLEFSLELLSKPSKNSAEQLQWERVNATFQGGAIQVWYKNTWPFLSAVLLIFAVYGLSLLSLPTENSSKTQVKSEDKLEVNSVANLPVDMGSVEISIAPPAYTGLPNTLQSELSVKTIINSDIKWVVEMVNAKDISLELINSNGKSLPFTKSGEQFILQDKVIGSGIYALQAKRDEKVVYESDYFPMEAIDDLAPVIQPSEKELYKYHFTKDPQVMQVKAKVSDDFKIKEVYLVATLARGSGENVKFRENRISIPKQNFKSDELAVTLDLNSFDFQPGDELYYYWAAMDNRLPEPNFSRSDTYFLNYVDSTGVEEQDLIGMAIHVMPEYFRSQRQIIIDTENLIATQKSMSEKEFNSASNLIGSDQKLLRMRYGQYLGEENSETNNGSEPVDFLAGHDHDHPHEAGVVNLVAEPEKEKSGSESKKAETNNLEDGMGGLMSAFLNKTQTSTKAKMDENSSMSLLKMALEEMWESELHLRLFEPEKALPFQHKALEYLKSVQQKSRAYVKRTGFDPPPIKEEEKRLTGELDDLKDQIEIEQIAMESRLAPLASQVLGLLPKQQLSAVDKALVQKFGELWTARMNYSGLQDWSVLLQLQELNSGKISKEGKKELFQKLYPLIARREGVNASFLKQKELEKAFWSKLQ
ncbi:hypothetical protein [Algoriphagus winogradskyi]|uniref:Tryptophan-rich sensory protein n=1 Tax=Algoriphagus winogradskyi TaxID=237017 RepID=A0ABY1NHK4_9BACT|nr:hypothetical protein [Algoriphagus winogradskyi]SMP07937.1 hypothetical protein SAMN06265367_101668 [Algoriphagus winogradskyi]